MGPARIAVFAAILLAAAAAAYWFWPWRAMPPPVAAPEPPPAPAAQGPKHPLAAPPEQPLPALAESDAPLVEALAGLIGMDAVARVLRPESLVRNIVATVDNLPRETVAQRINAVRPVGGVPVTSGRDEARILAPANSARYATYMRILDTVEMPRLVAVYRRFYPLFQEAYVELGYPGAYFNDRLVEVVDHLLATPEPAEPIRLTQPKVLYEFADPSLEAESAGRKALLRLGTENRRRVKVRLRELRALIAS